MKEKSGVIINKILLFYLKQKGGVVINKILSVVSILFETKRQSNYENYNYKFVTNSI